MMKLASAGIGYRVAITAIAVSAVLATTIATANAAACGNRKSVVEYLTKKYREQPRAMGMVSSSGVMEILVSEKGSWSILVTTATGRTCIVAAGDNWEDIRIKASGPAA